MDLMELLSRLDQPEAAERVAHLLVEARRDMIPWRRQIANVMCLLLLHHDNAVNLLLARSGRYGRRRQPVIRPRRDLR